ncbi:unnamed protein product [Hymenolepis diminuta]|uniref:Uncharacterized protein n=1 Tax=Hymenolepis diminuta TaxID=6216 RepID=A0A564ZD28_HYMDI|nr:unnamed protein product [Hymenolepis diminuta]
MLMIFLFSPPPKILYFLSLIQPSPHPKILLALSFHIIVNLDPKFHALVGV